MTERLDEKIQVLTTNSQKKELECFSMEHDMSQGVIVRAALDLWFEHQRALEGAE